MPDISIKITNLPQIKAAFSKSPILMARELNKAIALAVIGIEKDSRGNTPVDTGRLRASHYTRFGNLRGEVGTNTKYDMFVHEGTRFMQARPYLRDAVNSQEGKVEKLFESAVQNVLNAIGRSV